MQRNGNLVLISNGRDRLWETKTPGKGGAFLGMQEDGNIVLYKGSNVLWHANTKGKRVRHLILQNDCNLVLYNKHQNKPIWATNTLTNKIYAGVKWTDPMMGWSDDTTTVCGQFGNILGGYRVAGAGYKLFKQFPLPCEKSTVDIYFKFVRIDSWENERAYLNVNEKERWSRMGSHRSKVKTANVCGNSQFPDEMWNVVVKGVKVHKKVMMLEFGTDLSSKADDESWGIRDVRIVATCGHKSVIQKIKAKLKNTKVLDKIKCNLRAVLGGSDEMRPGAVLRSGRQLKSRNSKCTLRMQQNGKLVLREGNTKIWKSRATSSRFAVPAADDRCCTSSSSGTKSSTRRECNRCRRSPYCSSPSRPSSRRTGPCSGA